MSDLGGGKTTFVRGLARGAGSTDRVASPTFTISRVYEAGSNEIHHFDFYRLGEPGLIGEELSEVLNDPHIITVVEWADIVKDVLPTQRLTITITKTPTDGREFTFRAPQSLEYLIKAIQ
jgi:tRNA threonylcarbamoyladenosine biosynthesis protein TsaE